MDPAQSNRVYIPIRGADEQVEVDFDNLPDDGDDILEILKTELAPLHLYHRIAAAYYKRGNSQVFARYLEEASSPTIDETYRSAKADRIAILTALGSYYTELGQKADTHDRENEFYTKATQAFNRADRIDHQEPLSWVGKGVLLVTRGDLPRASEHFNTALHANPDFVPAKLGKACVLFLQGEGARDEKRRNFYVQALQLYRDVLRRTPNCPPAVRLGIGFCQERLKNPKAAARAFQRVLELDPRNVHALVSLSVLELNQRPTNEQEAKDLLMRAHAKLRYAFEVDQNNAMTLNHLADHFFHRQDMQKAAHLATTAHKATKSPHIRAESWYHLGRIRHACNDFPNALMYYQRAESLWPAFSMCQFRLGQMHIYRGEIDSAIECFTKVRKEFPTDTDTLRILGFLYSTKYDAATDDVPVADKEKAEDCFKRVLAANKTDIYSLVTCGILNIRTKPAKALAMFERAETVLESQEKEVPPALYNAIAAVHYDLGEMNAAISGFIKAIAAAGGPSVDPDDPKVDGLIDENIVTLFFNLARALEAAGMLSTAKVMYEEIQRQHPSWTDCLLRLGSMLEARGDYQGAENKYSEVFMRDDKNSDAWASLANLDVRNSRWKEAQKKLKKMAEIKLEPYAAVALGDIFYYTYRVQLEEGYMKTDNTPPEYLLDGAQERFKEALLHSKANAFAANGLGIVLAERGHVSDAREVFSRVQEAGLRSMQQLPDVSVNHAHVLLQHKPANEALRQSAVRMYENCLRKCNQKPDPELFLFLANAYFASERYEDCRRTLLRAIHFCPNSPTLWYNLALTNENAAVGTLKRNDPPPPAAQVERALKDLELAAQEFGRLAQMPTLLSSGEDITDPAGLYNLQAVKDGAMRHAEYCTRTLELARPHLEVALTRQRRAEAKRQEQLQKLAEKKQRRADELTRQQEEEKKRKEAAEAEAKELLERRSQLVDSWAREKEEKERLEREKELQREADEASGVKKKSKKKKKRDADESSEGERDEEPRPRKKKIAQPRPPVESDSSSDGELPWEKDFTDDAAPSAAPSVGHDHDDSAANDRVSGDGSDGSAGGSRKRAHETPAKDSEAPATSDAQSKEPITSEGETTSAQPRKKMRKLTKTDAKDDSEDDGLSGLEDVPFATAPLPGSVNVFDSDED